MVPGQTLALYNDTPRATEPGSFDLGLDPRSRDTFHILECGSASARAPSTAHPAHRLRATNSKSSRCLKPRGSLRSTAMDAAGIDETLSAATRGLRLLEHPFYRRWEAGELTDGELAGYAAQYRHFEAML